MFAVLFLFIACNPVQAPEGFDALASFLYEHFHADEALVQEGIVNLTDWVDENEDILSAGYRTAELTLDARESVDVTVTDPNLLGVAVSYDYTHSVEDLAYANFAVHPRDVFTNPDAINEREYVSDPACFLEQECVFLRHNSVLQRYLPFGLEMVMDFATDARWVETERGQALLQRRWLAKEVDINKEWLQLKAGYALSFVMPTEDGTAKQLEMVWGDAVLGDLPVPEDGAFLIVIDIMGNILEKFEEYLDNNEVSG